MYSYQHRYHAGNFADLHKHITLLAILEYLHKKPAGFFVLDAFAGEGGYNLSTDEAQKTQEYLTGFGLLKKLTADGSNNKNTLFQQLFNLTKENYYPGSPLVISSQLREQDRAVFIENHPQAYDSLLENILDFPDRKNKNIKIYKQNAYDAVKALVPYKESRGIIFVDPSYEVKEEYKHIAKLVINAFHKKPTGIYIIWYPLLVNKQYYKELFTIFDQIALDQEKVWHHKFKFYNNIEYGMYGSGLIVLNMPWTVDKIVEECFGYIS